MHAQRIFTVSDEEVEELLKVKVKGASKVCVLVFVCVNALVRVCGNYFLVCVKLWVCRNTVLFFGFRAPCISSFVCTSIKHLPVVRFVLLYLRTYYSNIFHCFPPHSYICHNLFSLSMLLLQSTVMSTVTLARALAPMITECKELTHSHTHIYTYCHMW